MQTPLSQNGIDFLQQRSAVFVADNTNVAKMSCATQAAAMPQGILWHPGSLPMAPGPEQHLHGTVPLVALPTLSSLFLPVTSPAMRVEGQQGSWALQYPGVFAHWIPAHQLDQAVMAANSHETVRAKVENQPSSSGALECSDSAPRKIPAKYPSPSPSGSEAGVDDSEELTILPRRRAGQPEDKKRDPIILTRKDLKELYGMQLSEAAARLDISTTAMKAVCRRAGITRWPYRRIQFYKSRGIKLSSVSDEVLMMPKTAKRKDPDRTAASVLAEAAMAHAKLEN